MSVDEIAVAALTDGRQFERLVEETEALQRSLRRQVYADGFDWEDMRQEVLLGLWAAVQRYDPAAGRFYPFAYVVILRRLHSIVKTSRRQCRFAEEAPMRGLSDLVPTEGTRDPERVVEMRERFTLIAGRLNDLSEIERESIRGLAEGLTYDEVCERTGAHWKQVDNALLRARRKLAA